MTGWARLTKLGLVIGLAQTRPHVRRTLAPCRTEYIIVQGGSAAKEVFTTPKLRDIILRLLDKGTLATMLRLHKAGSSSVAGILYHTINKNMVNKMSRASVNFLPQRLSGTWST